MSAVRLEVVERQQNTAKVNGRASLSSERGSEKLEFIEGDLASHERFMMLVSALTPDCLANGGSDVSMHAGPSQCMCSQYKDYVMSPLPRSLLCQAGRPSVILSTCMLAALPGHVSRCSMARLVNGVSTLAVAG